ncbi:MAG: hemerythrin domain-containing protein [Candidatus Omnitrophota bacterium]|nr:hemerythrin domain-containing protein [Candidatus Omnitrophota bacterium]
MTNSTTLNSDKRAKLKTNQSPTQLLREDHKKVKGLFAEFGKSKKPSRQKEIFETAAKELKVHMAIEKELFYPAARIATGDDELLDEAREEHHVIDMLISEIEELDISREEDQKVLCAKFAVLSENVKHHIEEEEEDLFPEFDKAKSQDKNDLVKQMEERRNGLRETVKIVAVKS